MKSNLSPRAKLESGKEATVLIEANYDHTNVHTPKLLQWDQVTLPDTWTLNNVIPRAPVKPRTQPIEIIENDKGHAEIIFKERSNFTSSRRSTSSVTGSRLTRQPSLRGVDWARIIPKAQYEVGTSSGTKQEEPLVSPPMSPTLSDMNPALSSSFKQQL